MEPAVSGPDGPLVVPAAALLPAVQKVVAPLPKLEGDARDQQRIEARPVTLPLPAPRNEDPARPVSMQTTPGLKQAGAVEPIETPNFRAERRPLVTAEPAMPSNLPANRSTGPELTQPLPFMTPTTRP